jgi:hypothetical protein
VEVSLGGGSAIPGGAHCWLGAENLALRASSAFWLPLPLLSVSATAAAGCQLQVSLAASAGAAQGAGRRAAGGAAAGGAAGPRHCRVCWPGRLLPADEVRALLPAAPPACLPAWLPACHPTCHPCARLQGLLGPGGERAPFLCRRRGPPGCAAGHAGAPGFCRNRVMVTASFGA